jgi:hypothetical protein
VDILNRIWLSNYVWKSTLLYLSSLCCPSVEDVDRHLGNGYLSITSNLGETTEVAVR